MRLDVENAPAECSQSDFAELIKVKPPYVTRLKQKGRLVLTADGKRVLVAESIARIRAARDPARGGDRSAGAGDAGAARGTSNTPTAREAFGPQPQGNGLVYQDEAAREKRAAAQLRELELGERAGSLVIAAEVDLQVFNLARAARDALMAIPDRVATILAAETDPIAVHARLTAECRKVCDELAARDATRAPAPAAEAA